MNLIDLQKRAIEIRKRYHDLERTKYGREWSTQELAMGFVGDVGDLMKLIQAKEGIRDIDGIDTKLGHELADCLWSVLVLASKYDVNLEEEFLKTMNELEVKIAKL